MRRVRRLNADVAAGQGELFTAWRYHHAKATTATIRSHLVHAPARIAHSTRLTLHLPNRWPWRHAFTALFDKAHAPPTH